MRIAALVLSLVAFALSARAQSEPAGPAAAGPVMIAWYGVDAQSQQSVGQTEDAQGGRLSFGGDRQVSAGARGMTEVLKLVDYRGVPLKALQLRIAATGGVRIRSVARGEDVKDQVRWNFSHDVKEARPGTGAGGDTAKIVILGNGPNELKGGASYSLLEVTFDLPSGPSAGEPSLRLHGVLGSTPRGENARVSPGTPMRLTFVPGGLR
jgi:hypothetical protein